MKKYLITLLIILLLCGCNKEDNDYVDIDVDYTYEIKCNNIDMSGYEGINSVDHCFKQIAFEEFFNCIKNKSSAVFYLSRHECGCCQSINKYLNEVAQDYGVVIYVMDAYQEDNALLDPSDTTLRDRFIDYLYDILDVDEEGNKALQTPTLIAIVNGEIYDSQICMNEINTEWSESKKEVEKLKLRYREILKPFVNKNQD